MNRILVLLAATIMGIAAIFTVWGSNLMKKTIIKVENTTPEETCHIASFDIYSGRYDKSSKNLYLVLNNKRSVDLRIEKLYIFYPNGEMKTFEINEILKGNMLRSINVIGVEDGFTSGTIKTNCPDVSVDFSYSQVA